VAKPLIQDLLAALELAAIIAAQIEQPRIGRARRVASHRRAIV
jgi:hypothetical protein